MASALIHLAVAKKVNEKLGMDEKVFLLGSIAPDVGKKINIPKSVSHFSDNDEGIPNIDKFINKYGDYLNSPFEVGYLVHLLTDKLWYSEFMKNYRNYDNCVFKNGEKVELNEMDFYKLIYNDYSNLNSQILDYYNMDLSVFYEEIPLPNIKIEEIPQEEIKDLINKMSTVITGDYRKKEYVLDIKNIVHFIEYATIYILDNLKKLNVLVENN